MCQKAAETAYQIMEAEEPTLKGLLSYTGLLNTPDGEAAIAAYDAAATALKSWVTGTPAQNVLQLIGDFQVVFATLPLPPGIELLTNIILGGVMAVIGILTANSPAPPAPASATAEPALTQAMYAHAVMAETTAKVQALVPGFRRSLFHTPAGQYKSTWNNAVKTGLFPESLRV